VEFYATNRAWPRDTVTYGNVPNIPGDDICLSNSSVNSKYVGYLSAGLWNTGPNGFMIYADVKNIHSSINRGEGTAVPMTIVGNVDANGNIRWKCPGQIYDAATTAPFLKYLPSSCRDTSSF
jgi:hypothetical protein